MKFTSLLFAFIVVFSCQHKSDHSIENKESTKTEEPSTPLLTDRNKIHFNFQHSMRIPYQEVNISISPKVETASVRVQCDPMHYDGKKWTPAPIDTNYIIDIAVYEAISQTIETINFPTIAKSFNTLGHDGNTCTIEYGSWQNTLKLSIWSPEFDTENRGLSTFLEACESILKVANLDPKEIL